MNHDLLNALPSMPYSDLWNLWQAKISISSHVAEEIKTRRRNMALPVIADLQTESVLNPRQALLYRQLKKAMFNLNVDIMLTTSMLDGGWVVYLTGDDDALISKKLCMTRDMIEEDVREFGQCRLFAVPITKEYTGLKLYFDRGLKCVFLRAMSVED